MQHCVFSSLRCLSKLNLPLLLAGGQHTGRVRVPSLVLGLRLRLLQPRLQNGLERDHVVVGQGEALEPADGALRQRSDAGQLQVGQRLADIRLRYPFSRGGRGNRQKGSILGKAKINPSGPAQISEEIPSSMRRCMEPGAGLSLLLAYRVISLPNFIRRCLKRSANASNSLGSVSVSGCRPAAATAAAIAGWCELGWPWCPAISKLEVNSYGGSFSFVSRN